MIFQRGWIFSFKWSLCRFNETIILKFTSKSLSNNSNDNFN